MSGTGRGPAPIFGPASAAWSGSAPSPGDGDPEPLVEVQAGRHVGDDHVQHGRSAGLSLLTSAVCQTTRARDSPLSTRLAIAAPGLPGWVAQ